MYADYSVCYFMNNKFLLVEIDAVSKIMRL